MVDYPRFPNVESGSESEDGLASRQKGKFLEVKSKRSYESDKQSSGESDKEVNELGRLLTNFGAKFDKSSGRDSGKKSGRESGKESGEESGKESSRKSERGSRKGKGREYERHETSGEEIGEEEEFAERTKATHHTKEQREAAGRVLKCSPMDYYGILGLKKGCPERDVRRAYRKLSLLCHPDQNRFKDAEKAFRRELSTLF